MHEIIYAIKTKALEKYNRYFVTVYTALSLVVILGIVTVGLLLYRVPEMFIGISKYNTGHFLTVITEYKISLLVMVLLLFFTSWTFALMTRYALDVVEEKEISYKQLLTCLSALPSIFFIMTSYSIFWALCAFVLELLLKKFERSATFINIASPYILAGLLLAVVGFLIVAFYIHVRFMYYINFSLFLLVDEKKRGLWDLKQLQKMISQNTDMLNQLYIFTGRRWPLWMCFPINILQLSFYRYIIDGQVYQLLMHHEKEIKNTLK